MLRFVSLFCPCPPLFPYFIFISRKVSQDNVFSISSHVLLCFKVVSVFFFFSVFFYFFFPSCMWNTLSISNTTAPAILQFIFYFNSTLGYHLELTCYFSLAAKFPITLRVKDLYVAATQLRCSACVGIFSCAMFIVSRIASLQPSCVLRSARSLGGLDRWEYWRLEEG